jgi:hypothetical protein
MPLRLALLALPVALLFAAPAAQADITVSNVSAKPANVKAGANSDFTLSFELGGSETIRDLDLNLPAGLIGNPNNAAQCSQADFESDSCPPQSQVGTQVVNVTVGGLITMDANGTVYNLKPDKPEPAQLGIKLNPPPPAAPQHLKSDVTVRPSDSGLTSTIRNIPNTLNGLPLHINKITLTLQAQSGAKKPFMTNPTSCDPAPTTLHVVGDGDSAQDGHASFTPTSCADLPFAPKLTATIGGKGQNLALPTLTSIITQQPGEANSKQAKVTLLTPLGPNAAVIGSACPVPKFDADDCPDSSIVGHANAVTPLLATPLDGPVRLVDSPGQLPNLVVYLNGTINVRLVGKISVPAAGTVTTFDGIPDVPLSRFKLDFNGGQAGLVGATKDICANSPKIKGEFLAHSGATKNVTITPTVKGCPKTGPKPPAAKPPRPVGSASLKGLAGKSPTLKASAKRKSGGKQLSFISVQLPPGLSFARAKLGKGLKATKGVKGSLSGKRTLKLRSKSATGKPSIAATVYKGALKVSPGVRKRVRKHPKVKIVLKITEVGGRTTKLTKRVKLR